MMTLLVNARGVVRCVYVEDLDLAAIGALEISRASHVEPDEAGRWWADITPVGGPVLGPFDRRSDALAAEQRWLDGNLPSVAIALDQASPASGLPVSINPLSHSGGSPRHQDEGVET